MARRVAWGAWLVALTVWTFAAGPTAHADEKKPDPPRGGPAAAETATPELSDDEVKELKALHASLPPDQQAQMRAYYKDLGVDLDLALGFSDERSAADARTKELLEAMGQREFARTPQAVLAARSKLGYGQVPHPDPGTAKAADLVAWLHLHAMAGEWAALGAFFRLRPPSEGQALYSAVLQSLNTGDPGLLPEEVLGISDAAPEALKPWQVTTLAALLGTAAKRHGTGPVLARLGAGTTWFGAQDPERRRRTVQLLAGAGLVVAAYAYLPPLDQARAEGDAELLLVHARYLEDLATTSAGAEADGYRTAAWKLFGEAALAPKASYQGRYEAITRAVALVPHIPKAQVDPWLGSLFASDTLGPVALEVMALRAVAIGDAQQNAAQRAQAILTLKEGADILLARGSLDASVLRVPLRMLTTAVVAQLEEAVTPTNPNAPGANVQLLLRAVPSKAWFDALEPSLATRAGKASVAIAILADETDLALSLLADAIARQPPQAAELADGFLHAWHQRLRPSSDRTEDEAIWYFYRDYLPSAPLTRGYQRRNLARLHRLMATLQSQGVDPRKLANIAPTFQACHSRTEVYDKLDVERVFGPLDGIPPDTAAALASTMATSLNGDWRNRAVQREAGTKRTDPEIAALVDRGYGLALELVAVACTARPDSWAFAALQASLAYDRMRFQEQAQKTVDPVARSAYRQAAFTAFEHAADRYARAVRDGTVREDPDVYLRWFGAAMGSGELAFLDPDEVPVEGPLADDQVERIRRAIAALPPDSAFRHTSEVARALGAAVGQSDPEVKPRLVRQALRLVGDHPAGATLRALDELYRDLVKDEIKLRLTIDGSDRVGTGKPFGVMVSLRFTNAVDREVGGFSKYLQNGVWTRVGRQYREVDYKDQVQKRLEAALAKGFVVEAIGFFDAFIPARGVTEDGQDGWLEKPMAYVVLTRKDPSVDRLPQVALDMQFSDATGPVTLVLPSNAPPLAIDEHNDPRPCPGLAIAQVVDVRDARDPSKGGRVTLEVRATGRGAIPDLRDVLSGVDVALPGYAIGDGGIEASPTLVLQDGEVQARSGWGGVASKPPEGGYPEADAAGIWRMPIERTWKVTYTPATGAMGDAFRVPALATSVAAMIESKHYADADVVPVVDGEVPLEPRASAAWWLGGGLVAVVLGAAIAVRRRRRGKTAPETTSIALPKRVTPLSTVTTLRRILAECEGGLDAAARARLAAEIAELERRWFGPGPDGDRGELERALRRWVDLAGTTRNVERAG